MAVAPCLMTSSHKLVFDDVAFKVKSQVGQLSGSHGGEYIFEKSVNFYHTTQRGIKEDGIF